MTAPEVGETTASLKLALTYLHQRVELRFDRPAGTLHPVHGYRYPINYGYVPGTLAPDGDELDGYCLGTDQPLEHADGVVIAVIHRIDDDDPAGQFDEVSESATAAGTARPLDVVAERIEASSATRARAQRP